ncbi:unnamed protein product [Cyclocybe aegerita]|uniref:CCD97-like C-terminal domain-containing protein n=1 Tax=Cyclocybe aegerita TaxID=1973307 RepID=A0A8S0VX25_CYCAE|nr:unnamed protein product [Cyclocybe aegerita]
MSSAPISTFDKTLSLKYLGLPHDYSPSPETDPVAFLIRHLSHLPPNILHHYSQITTPKQRTNIPSIRNRRLQYTRKNPSELRFESAMKTWPNLWGKRERGDGQEEKAWGQNEFLQGRKQHVGKLGSLLGEYEEEREAQRTRDLWRAPAEDDLVPEEDTDSDDEGPSMPEQETEDEARTWFERRIRERFIYGLLDNVDYGKIDWDETLNGDNEREAEERWFDDEDEP